MTAVEAPAKKLRRVFAKDEALGDHTVESLLTLARDRLLAEIDAVTNVLVSEAQEACGRASESLREEFAQQPQDTSYTVALSTTAGPHAGATFTLSVGPEPCFVGRSSGKKFRLKGISLPKDNEVSTTHAKILRHADGVAIVDVGSTNGTVLDGDVLQEAETRPLHPASTIIIGSSSFTVDSITPSCH